MEPLIPIRPERSEYPLTESEMNVLTWFVISGCTKEDAYKYFMQVPTDMPAAALKRSAQELFSIREARDYVASYRLLLTRLMAPPQRTPTPQPSPPPSPSPAKTKDDKERKIKAVEKLKDFVIQRMSHIEGEENPDEVIKFADKLGLLDDGEVVAEQPRRYLPVSCGSCEYKKFVEENCEKTDG